MVKVPTFLTFPISEVLYEVKEMKNLKKKKYANIKCMNKLVYCLLSVRYAKTYQRANNVGVK